mmetsp:Transcript_4403/g.6411  ORF Transcript_4403/g.6411 Transcript_4403/m.6411 type:complete len:189 (-) Transcript_4403:684-1250(-)|eukprot:CAMPEP_0170495156 /NCGR_PEP_ID=MMETSP0208-20121228/15047_1 /TAXON_ID=197538 /ORGANISM="Strombidium inclinatum, Strain S3" /LENGTH=188 /DNA_ID=CAMNT_0010771303 /DNA_START=380 /DNA_END=946 /DNA_ORIENTATION=-
MTTNLFTSENQAQLLEDVHVYHSSFKKGQTCGSMFSIKIRFFQPQRFNQGFNFRRGVYKAIESFYRDSHPTNIFDFYLQNGTLWYGEVMEKRAAIAKLGDLAFKEFGADVQDENFPKVQFEELNILQQMVMQSTSQYHIPDQFSQLKRSGSTPAGQKLLAARLKHLKSSHKKNFVRARLYGFQHNHTD